MKFQQIEMQSPALGEKQLSVDWLEAISGEQLGRKRPVVPTCKRVVSAQMRPLECWVQFWA